MIPNPLIHYKDYTDDFKKLYANISEDHGWEHIVNVVWNARSVCMANNIPYSKEIELAAVLHDVGNSINRNEHNILSAKMVPYILSDLNIDTSDIDVEDIQNGCRYHRASEKENIDNMSITVRVVSAADRMRPSANKEDLFKDVYYRAYEYCLNHTEEVDDPNDPAYSSWKWVHDTYTTDNARSKYYSDLYKNTFEDLLIKQKNLVAKITLDEYKEWLKREKGIGLPIEVS